MSVLIRDARFSGAPLLLARTQSAGRKGPSAQSADLPGAPLDRVHGRQVRSADAQTAVPLMAYEEFEQRLGEKLEDMRREAREQGLRDGRESGYADVQQQHSAQLEAMAAFVRAARSSLDQNIAGLAEVGSEVVFEAVVKIVGQLGTDREAIAAIVREVIRGAKDRSRLLVRVRGADLELLTQHRSRFLEGLDAGSVEIVADDRVTLGGCILETPVGNLDGRLETQLANLRHVLLSTQRQPEGDR